MSEDYKVKYEGKSLSELAEAMAGVKAAHSQKESEASALYNEYEFLRKVMIPELMDDMGLSTVTVTGVGRLSLKADAYVSVVADAKHSLHSWLRDNGFEALIAEVVNPSTLKAFIKEQVQAGREVPGPDVVRYDPYTMVTLTKK